MLRGLGGLFFFVMVVIVGYGLSTMPDAGAQVPAPSATTPAPSGPAIPSATPIRPVSVPATPSPSPSPSPTPTPAPIYVVPPTIDAKAPFTTDAFSSSLTAYMAAAGANPTIARAEDVIASRLAPTILTTVDTTKKKVTFTLVPLDPGAGPTIVTSDLPMSLTDSAFVAAVRRLTNQALSGFNVTSLVPNRRYDLVIVPDTDLNDQSNQQTATTAFAGSTYFESRARVDFLQWKINAVSVSDYYRDLNGSNDIRMPTSFVNQVKQLCATQPGLYVLRYSIAYSETPQAFWGTQQGYSTIDAVLYHCPGIWNPFGFLNPLTVPIDDRRYIAHYNFTIHRRNGTTNGKVFNAFMIALNAGLNGLRGKYKYDYFLGSGNIVAGSFLQNPGTNATVTQAVGEASRYVTCASFIEIVSPLLEPDHARPFFIRDNRDREPCPTAKALFDAYSVEYTNRSWYGGPASANPQLSPLPVVSPSPLSERRIPP